MSTPKKRRIKYAVVGLGNIAQVAVLPAFEHAKESSELVALVSSSQTKLRALGKRYRVKYTGSYEELERVLTESGADAVYVAVPNAQHCEMTRRAARAGVHVLCEKPMAVDEGECEAMVRATRDAKVKLMIAYRLHFEAANLGAIEQIKHGVIGEPRIFSSLFCQQVREGDIRTRGNLGGGAMFDMGIYCLNAARYLFQSEPTDVFARRIIGSEERFRTVDEMTTAVLRFPGNRLAQMTASQGASDVSEFRVVGTKGDIRLEPAFDYAKGLRSFVTVGGKTTTKSFPKSDQFAPELVHFSRCILDGREPEPSARQGEADVRILRAMIRSAESGKNVHLTPYEPEARPSKRLEMRKPPVKKVHTVQAPSPSR